MTYSKPTVRKKCGHSVWGTTVFHRSSIHPNKYSSRPKIRVCFEEIRVDILVEYDVKDHLKYSDWWTVEGNEVNERNLFEKPLSTNFHSSIHLSQSDVIAKTGADSHQNTPILAGVMWQMDPEIVVHSSKSGYLNIGTFMHTDNYRYSSPCIRSDTIWQKIEAIAMITCELQGWNFKFSQNPSWSAFVLRSTQPGHPIFDLWIGITDTLLNKKTPRGSSMRG